MPRLLLAALLGLAALPVAPAAAQDLLAEDAQVREIDPEAQERSYPLTDADGTGASMPWRVVLGLGNCCETYLATDAEGRLFDYGGNYVNVSRDRGRTWTEVRQRVQMLGGEGAIVAGPNGDMYGVGWDPYSGDTLVSMRYSAATGKWQTARMLLHAPFYDREWISYVPGPITIAGDTFPFVLFVKGGWPSKEQWLYSTDGLTYLAVSSKMAESVVFGSVREAQKVDPNPGLDLIQANGGMGLTPLGGGRAISEPEFIFGQEYHLLEPDFRWRSFSFPEGIAGQIHSDSRGRLHNVVDSTELGLSQGEGPEAGATGWLEYRLSEDGGKTFRAARAKLPEGHRVRESDFRARGAIGLAAVAVRLRNDATGVERDMVYKFDVRGAQPALIRSYQVGRGDLVSGSGVASSVPRFDFESVVMFPDGRVALSMMDSETGGQPAIAVELGNPVPAGWEKSAVPAPGPVAVPPPKPAAAPGSAGPTAQQEPVDASGPPGTHRVRLKARRRGGRIVVTGEVLPRHRGHVVRVERRKGRRWVRVATARAGKRSTFARTLRLRGRVTLRAVALEDGSGHGAGRSRSVSVRGA